MIILHLENIDKTVKSSSYIDRELNDDRFLSERLLKAVERVLPVCLFPVKLVDAEDDRHVVIVRVACENLCSNLYSLLGVGDENRRVAHSEC